MEVISALPLWTDGRSHKAGRQEWLNGNSLYRMGVTRYAISSGRSLPGPRGSNNRPMPLGKEEQMNALSVSVVICAHSDQRWDDTLAAVDSVRRQNYAAKELIVVVDHNPHLFGRLKSTLLDAIVTENREGPGLSGGKNTGIAVATGEVVAFLDDDAVAEPDWLRFLVESYSDPTVVGVGG